MTVIIKGITVGVKNRMQSKPKFLWALNTFLEVSKKIYLQEDPNLLK